MPINGKCSVPADEHWTKQEIFVWERVCAGKVANFNEAPGYGGDLDAKRPEALPESRVLTSVFLETILLQDEYRRALTRRGIRIVGARFREMVDLENAELGHELWLDRSLLEQGANFRGLRSTHLITFDGSKVIGTLSMNGLKVDQSLFMRDKAEFAEVDFGHAHVGGQLDVAGSKFTGKLSMNGLRVDASLIMHDKAEFTEVILVGAHVGGTLDLMGSSVTGKLNMNSLQVDQALFMRANAEFAEVDLGHANVGGTLDLDSSKVTGKLNMNGLKVDGSLFMRDRAEFAEVSLIGAHVGGQLSLIGSKVTGKLSMNGLQVDQSLFMRAKAEFAEVDLVGAHVGGTLDLDSSKVTGKLNMNGLKVDQGLFMREKAGFAQVDLVGAHVGGTLELNGSKVTGELNMNRLKVDASLLMRDEAEFADVDLGGAHVGGQLDLSGSKVIGKLNCDAMNVAKAVFLGRGAEFSGPIDLIVSKVEGDLELARGIFHQDVDVTGTQIGGELRLGSARHAPAQWPGNPTLILRNAKADAIQDLSNAWPARLDLNGFTYRSLGGIHAAEGDPMAERNVKWFKGWLGRQQRYTPQPYEQLALVLQNQGQIEKAAAIRYAGRKRERDEALKRWRRGQHLPDLSRWLWLTALHVLIGYGYRPWRALYWAIGFVVLGAAVLWLSGEGPRHGMPIGLAYSFDMLLPIVKLREWHYHIDLAGWARYYFYGHKIMGYVLASFLIAGLSGLTKKT